MIDTNMLEKMVAAIDERLKERGQSYRTIGRDTRLAHTTIENIHKRLLKRGPSLDTFESFWLGMGYSKHDVAHMALGLKPPGEMGEPVELSEDAKFFLQKFQMLNDADRQQLLGYLDGLQERKGAI